MIKSNQNRIHTDQSLLSGIKEHLGKGGSLVIDGEKLSAAEIINLLQGRIDAAVHVTATRAAWQLAVKQNRAKEDETKQSVSTIRQTILLMYASKNDVLADFGLSPRRARRALTAAEKVDVTDKARATRQARHTMGKRQKETVKGDASNAPPVVVTPPAVQPVANDKPSPAPTPAQIVASPVAPALAVAPSPPAAATTNLNGSPTSPAAGGS
jgi:hypothetical protein